MNNTRTIKTQKIKKKKKKKIDKLQIKNLKLNLKIQRRYINKIRISLK